MASEVAPYSKTGGLGDVAGALPKALARRGHEVCVVTPLYKSVFRDGLRQLEHPHTLRFPFGAVETRFWCDVSPHGVTTVFVDAPAFFERQGLYEENGVAYPDNARRFGFFGAAALTFAQGVGFRADVVHLNDWHTGLAALALKRGFAQSSLRRAKVVMTVHNLAYQGNFQKGALFDLGVPEALFTPAGVEFHGQLSFMKAGLTFADTLTTVSPTYARDIQTPAFGEQLDGVLRARAASLHGVLNGIDTDVWDPATDALLPARFRRDDLKGKAFCQRELRKRMGLPLSGKATPAPLFAFIGRLVDQKGVELLLKTLPMLLEKGADVVVLGTGEAKYEAQLGELAQWHPKQLGVRLGFDEALAHLIFAASDFLLMPSKFEPCGLNQMYAMRYGAVPVVHATGGLDDSVIDLSRPDGTGLKFTPYTAEAFGAALERALALFAALEKWGAARERAMSVDHSWGPAAAQYESLYL